MKYFWIAVTIEENEKLYSYALKVSESDNLINKLKIKNIINANICPTKKAACELVETWRESQKNQGLYMFDDLQF